MKRVIIMDITSDMVETLKKTFPHYEEEEIMLNVGRSDQIIMGIINNPVDFSKYRIHIYEMSAGELRKDKRFFKEYWTNSDVNHALDNVKDHGAEYWSNWLNGSAFLPITERGLYNFANIIGMDFQEWRIIYDSILGCYEVQRKTEPDCWKVVERENDSVSINDMLLDLIARFQIDYMSYK